MIRVLIVDDHPLICKGIRLMLSKSLDIQVIGESHDGQDALLKMEQLNPDVVLLDLSMPLGLDGFFVCDTLKKQYPHIKVVILTVSVEQAYISRAISVGANGYISKNCEAEILVKAIRNVYDGEQFFNPTVSEDKISHWSNQKNNKTPKVLTNQEEKILRLTYLGYTNIDIAEQLIISPKTVENHKTKINKKLGITTKKELIQYVINNKLVSFIN